MGRNLRPLITRWGTDIGIPGELETCDAVSALELLFSPDESRDADEQMGELIWWDGTAALAVMAACDITKAIALVRDNLVYASATDALLQAFLEDVKRLAGGPWQEEMDDDNFRLLLDYY